MEHPYRVQTISNNRRFEAWSRVKGALGLQKDPLLDDFSKVSVPSVIKKIAELVSDWYVPYLRREIREALYYEDALIPASLLAFSGKLDRLMTVGELLLSRRPMDILVSTEILGDVVAFLPPSYTRDMAIMMLHSSQLEIARDELSGAVKSSGIGLTHMRQIPVTVTACVPGARAVCHTFYISTDGFV